MANTTYQVILSTDGKHTVIATTDSAPDTANAKAWATSTYEAIVERYGLKWQDDKTVETVEQGRARLTPR